jgi:hypothetical protein
MLIDGYMQEVEVRVAVHPPSFIERRTTGFDGHIGCFVAGFPFIGAPGEIITKEAFLWLATFPAVAVDCMKIIRYTDDFTSYEVRPKPKHPYIYQTLVRILIKLILINIG